jgi:hypothetical protein
VARFRSLVPNPVGGLYDHAVQHESPLWRTYYARYPEASVFEGFAERLREAGLAAFKDYTDAGNPRLLDATVRGRDPLVVSAKLLRLRHDQFRQASPIRGDFEGVFAVLELTVRDARGAVRLQLRREVTVKVPAGGMNLLQLAGAVFADSLIADAKFRAALGAS